MVIGFLIAGIYYCPTCAVRIYGVPYDTLPTARLNVSVRTITDRDGIAMGQRCESCRMPLELCGTEE